MCGTDDDVRWVVQAQCGDRDATEHVLRTVQIPQGRYVQRLVGPTVTDDVLQTALISIAKHIKWVAEPMPRRSFRMANEYDHVLRNGLDAVDRGRRWAILGLGALFGATILTLLAVAWTGSRMAAP